MAHVKVSGTGVKQQIVTRTVADTTLYVRTGGSDSNNGLTIGTALATIQAAIDKIPKFIEHNILIDIGEGDFAGLYLEGYTVVGENVNFSSLTIKGVLGAPTLASGTPTGTSDGGGTGYFDDATQDWTVDELVGMFVGDRPIISNTATRVVVGTSHYYSNGYSYTIEIPLTNIVSLSADPRVDAIYEPLFEICDVQARNNYQSFDANFKLESLRFEGDAKDYRGIQYSGSTTLDLEYIQWFETSGALGILRAEGRINLRIASIVESGGVGITDCMCEFNIGRTAIMVPEGHSGFYAENVNKISIDECWFEGAYSVPFFNSSDLLVLWRVNYIEISDTSIINSGESGILAYGTVIIKINLKVKIDNCEVYGIAIGIGEESDDYYAPCKLIYGHSNNSLDGNGYGGILASHGSYVIIKHSISGTSGDYGLELQTGATCILQTGSMALTGSTADATINGGMASITWDIELADDGDTVTNTANGCRIERDDV